MLIVATKHLREEAPGFGLNTDVIVGRSGSETDPMIANAAILDGVMISKLYPLSLPMITWNHARRQALHLFGHVHNNWLGSRNAVNVGADVWDLVPVSFEQVAEG